MQSKNTQNPKISGVFVVETTELEQSQPISALFYEVFRGVAPSLLKGRKIVERQGIAGIKAVKGQGRNA